MDQEESIKPGFTETINITDGIFLKHTRHGKVISHRLISRGREINLLSGWSSLFKILRKIKIGGRHEL